MKLIRFSVTLHDVPLGAKVQARICTNDKVNPWEPVEDSFSFSVLEGQKVSVELALERADRSWHDSAVFIARIFTPPVDTQFLRIVRTDSHTD